MITRSFKAKVLVLGVFFVGVVTGVFLLNIYETRVLSGEVETAVDTPQTGAVQPAIESDDRARRERRRTSAAREVQRFQDYLGLDDQQRVQTEAILDQTRTDFRKLSSQTQTEYDMIREESRNQIKAILTTDEQRRKYEEIIERQNRRTARRRDRN